MQSGRSSQVQRAVARRTAVDCGGGFIESSVGGFHVDDAPLDEPEHAREAPEMGTATNTREMGKSCEPFVGSHARGTA